MSTHKAKQLHLARSGLTIALSGACLLALCVLLGQSTHAEHSPLHEPATSGPVLTAPLLQANGAYTQYMPLVTRNYGALINGDFEQGLNGWETEQGPFQASGSGLPVGTEAPLGNGAALLGRSDLIINGIPVGYGMLYQSFIVRDRYLRFRYWVRSYDVAYSSGLYHDTFEVAINRSPAYVSNAERDARGCSGAALNPQSVLAVSADGLVFCGGHPGASGGVLWDSGWRTVTLDLNAYHGQWITLAMAVWSREYVLPFTSDQAWYNTWSYVDDLQFTSSAAAAAGARADPPPPIASGEARAMRFPWNVEGVTPPR